MTENGKKIELGDGRLNAAKREEKSGAESMSSTLLGVKGQLACHEAVPFAEQLADRSTGRPPARLAIWKTADSHQGNLQRNARLVEYSSMSCQFAQV